MVGFRTRTVITDRRGFTMIEIMVVIVIIAILIGLLLPALASARLRVRIAQVKGEISNLENAIGAFKNRFGIEPPSRIMLWENPGTDNGWATTNPSQDAIDSLAILRQLWPSFNHTMLRDLDNDGDKNGGPFLLITGECLVFFLGGMPNGTTVGGMTQFAPSGFSKNPTDPFAPGGTREGPFFEFKTDRFTDLGTSGFPEYKDPFPAQKSPYLYYSSYEGTGYREPLTNVTAEYGLSVNPTGPSLAYRQGSTVAASPFKSKSFQIISPGQDNQFGPGGPYVSGASDPLPAWSSSSFTNWAGTALSPSTSDRDVERDNITNFSNGPLVP